VCILLPFSVTTLTRLLLVVRWLLLLLVPKLLLLLLLFPLFLELLVQSCAVVWLGYFHT
jgi:hypothetical protein